MLDGGTGAPARAVTFDLDWAPDWAIALCADICAAAGVPATWFVTHDCDVLADLRRAPERAELGVHPNLLPNSDHGESPCEVLGHCLAIVPEAKSMRTHGLVQSSALFSVVADETPIETDVSLLLPFHPNLEPTSLFLGREGRRIVRLPYFWEDDVAASWPGWDWRDGSCESGGLQIYDFHPIHVALNTDTMDRYAAVKAHLDGRPLTSLSEAECARFRNPGHGARTYLERLVAEYPAGSFARVSDLAPPCA